VSDATFINGGEGLRDSKLAPDHPSGRRYNCPGHVGLQHTWLDRDEIADGDEVWVTPAAAVAGVAR
jgi:hypothetical protein